MGQPQNILNKLYPYDVLGTAKSLNSTKSNSLSKLSDHDRVCVLLLSKKGQNNWLDEVLTFREIGLELPSLTIPYEDISKVKLIFEPVNEEFFKIKITALEQETLIAAAGYTGNCLHFYIFARILNAKLDLKGKKPAQLPAPSSEVPAVIMKNSLIYGNLLKKSRFLGWKEVFVAIGKDGLYCYKKLGDDGSLLIPRGTIK